MSVELCLVRVVQLNRKPAKSYYRHTTSFCLICWAEMAIGREMQYSRIKPCSSEGEPREVQHQYATSICSGTYTKHRKLQKWGLDPLNTQKSQPPILRRMADDTLRRSWAYLGPACNRISAFGLCYYLVFLGCSIFQLPFVWLDVSHVAQFCQNIKSSYGSHWEPRIRSRRVKVQLLFLFTAICFVAT